MPYLLRVTKLPSLAEISKIPQIVIVDNTGPAIPLGVSVGLTMLVGEFLKGGFAPQEVTSGGQFTNLYGGISSQFSQDATGIQNAGGVNYNGNGALQILSKSFRRLGITRVDTEVVTTDGGSTKATIAVTLTIAAADQAAGLTNKDIVVPGGTRFGNSGTFAGATAVVACSQDVLIPKGSTVTANQVTVSVNAYVVKEVEPIVAIAPAAITSVIDPALSNVSNGTSITGVTNATALWPPGTGTTLSARIETRYLVAIIATLPNNDSTQDITAIWAARRSTLIRQALSANATSSSEIGRGRVAVLSVDPAANATPAGAAAALTAAAALASSESLQSDRVMLTGPHTKIFSADLGITVPLNPDGWAACILSNFANERNPGANPQGLLNAIASLEDAFVANPPAKQDYVNLLAGGVSPLQKDRQVGWWLVNGITAVNPTLQATRVPMKRRRMADEIQDSIADISAAYQKEPATTERVDSFISELETYLAILKSDNNPAAQRIQDFAVDGVTLNDPNLTALGIYTIGISVRLLASMDDIVFQTTIGETVTIPQAA